MRPFLLYLRNVIVGALLGYIATGAALFVCDYLLPAAQFTGVFWLGLTPFGVVIALLLTRRTLQRAKQNAPVLPPDDKYI